MTKIIAVTGATGTQGGGVVNVMKKTPGWTIRAITRNPASEAAKKLAAEGVEVVQASFDDEASLVKAFEGAHAIFAVTNWWEPLFSGKSREESSAIEEAQAMAIAQAADQTPTLEHYFWSTTPGTKYARPKIYADAEKTKPLLVPHMDAKATVDVRIRAELPRLAEKTTYLYFGYFPQNIKVFPLLKPVKMDDGRYVQIVASSATGRALLSGDMSVTPGLWVRQALATGKPAMGKYANVALEKWTFGEQLAAWSEVTGLPAVFVPTTAETWEQMWGQAGLELATQFQWQDQVDPWAEENGEGREFISPRELGIREEEVPGCKATFEKMKAEGWLL